MKMLTLWACVESTAGPQQDLAADTSLAWKQAWQALGSTAKPATGAISGKCPRANLSLEL
jgi:hypothetical protein